MVLVKLYTVAVFDLRMSYDGLSWYEAFKGDN